MKLPDNILQNIIKEFNNENNEFEKTLLNGSFDISIMWREINSILQSNGSYNIPPSYIIKFINDEEENIMKEIIELIKQKIALFLSEIEVNEKEV